MTQQDTTTLHPAMRRQLDALASRDLDELMENYTQDAVLVRFDGTAIGAPQIREALGVYLTMEPELLELKDYVHTDDVIFYRADMKLGGQPENAFGTLVLRDGLIWRQTAGFGS